jgi:hypothetical protein
MITFSGLAYALIGALGAAILAAVWQIYDRLLQRF